jgi:geranylgeranyl diphosphate synthase type I
MKLIQGQHLDLTFEGTNTLELADYWVMVGGKTAALLGSAAELGAIAAGASEENCRKFYQFGNKLGLAFQVVDDWLGIWGDQEKTGKSTESDLVTGKKTLPILYALNKQEQFATLYNAGPLKPDDVPEAVQLLKQDGAERYTLEHARQLTAESVECLQQALDEPNEAGAALLELAEFLTNRKF